MERRGIVRMMMTEMEMTKETTMGGESSKAEVVLVRLQPDYLLLQAFRELNGTSSLRTEPKFVFAISVWLSPKTIVIHFLRINNTTAPSFSLRSNRQGRLKLTPCGLFGFTIVRFHRCPRSVRSGVRFNGCGFRCQRFG